MPQLKSGRAVGVSASPILDQIRYGTDESVSAVIVAYRLTVRSPSDLRDFLTVCYCREAEGVPPNARLYSSGFLVKQVREGKAGWSRDEIDEFGHWLDTDPRVAEWLIGQFDEIDAAIRESVIWDTAFWTDDDSRRPDQ
jgi:hypothetical protein